MSRACSGGGSVCITTRIGGLALMALWLLAPADAGAADAAIPLVSASSYPQFVTAVDVYSQSAQYNTGNLFNDHLYRALAYDVTLGLQANEHFLIAFRGQEAWVNVFLPLAPQTIDVHSRSYGLRARFNWWWFDWDTTASLGFNDNSTSFPDIFGGPPTVANWTGREYAVVSTVGARVPLGFLVFEPRGGGRVNALNDDGYTAGFIMLPAQFRSTTTWIGQAKISAPIHLDEFGILTPWVSGEVSRTTNPNPPLGVLTDLTGMAGGHYVINIPAFEGPGPFPGQTWRTASAGLRLDVTPSFYMDASAIWSWADLGNWRGYHWSAVVKF